MLGYTAMREFSHPRGVSLTGGQSISQPGDSPNQKHRFNSSLGAAGAAGHGCGKEKDGGGHDTS